QSVLSGLYQIGQCDRTFGVDLPALDFAALAAAVGAAYAAPGDDLTQVVRRAMDTPGPTVIDIPVGDSGPMRRARIGAQARTAGRAVLGRRVIDWLKRLR